MMRITRVRLVNFHNFVDETIEVAGGGHLFLLGDNGSGKTTVLDAVHCALSGAQLELNAAARVGGRRDEGRSLQGVALRYDYERGVRSEGGAIAYAAIEVEDAERDVRMSLGIGIEATTMDARVTKWGFVSARALDDVPLVSERDGARFPATREGLFAALPGDVYYRIGDYRAAVAARLMGGPERYREACQFWNMAKSYREIVAGARDFAALFRRLLPAPDPKVFGEIIRSLRKIADLEVALDELGNQRGYVAGLLELAGEVRAQREAATRYQWLACHRKREATADDLAASHERSARLAAELDDLEREIGVAEARMDVADDAVRAAQAEDGEGVAGKLRDAERARVEADAQVAACGRDEREAEAQAEAAQQAAERARTALARAVDTARTALSAAVDAASNVPGDLPRCRRLADGMPAAPPSGWAAAWAEARDEAAGVAANAEARHGAAAARLERARVDVERWERERDELARHREEQPRVAGYAAALVALAEAGIEARPIYELCEPRAGADAARLAWLESMAGDASLAALVVAEAERERAAALVGARARGVRVIVRTSDAVALPAWAEPLFGAPAGAAERTALAALAAAVEQGAALGPVGEAERGLLQHRGAAFAPDADAPRLVGRAARERAHAARVAAVEAELERAREAVAGATAAVELAAARVELLARLAAAVGEARSAALATAESLAVAAEDTASLRRRLAAEARVRADAARSRLAEIAARVAALRARADAMHLDELQARIAELERLAKLARRELRDLQGAHGERAADARREVEHRALLDAQRAAFEQELAGLGDELRAQVPALAGVDDAQLEHHVRVVEGGDRFKTIDNIEARVAECRRREQAAADELERDGSRGVRHIQYAARFGFGYDRAANRLVDRRDQPAAGVLADLDRTIAEQRGVVNADTRELMETLIMSGLARDLQAQIERLDGVIKETNRMLGGIRFGRSEYQFRATPRADRRELVDVVRRISVLDADSRDEFRAWIEDRRDELRTLDDDEVPDILDYRSWYDFRLLLKTEGLDGVDLTERSVRALGSGGEQGVPNYLLVLALGALMFDSGGCRLRPLLFDEAFYGIDAGRRDQLLRFATELGLQLLVASPDQDGVTPSARVATTLFVVKDAHGDVHLAPYHYWHKDPAPQGDLFAVPQEGLSAQDAECRLATAPRSPSPS